MRDLHSIDFLRDHDAEVRIAGRAGDDQNGAFLLTSPIDNGILRVIASSNIGWEHVSVSRATRPPNWPEMDYVKRMFWNDSDTVMQLHVPPDDHINNHPFTLHLWRPLNTQIPRPPGWMVGIEGMTPAEAEALVKKRAIESGGA